ncbi:hypothetical protein COOONC_12900 [Cooperia oncophora]
MLQRDFIALLPQHLAEMILSNLDARTLAACEAIPKADSFAESLNPFVSE